MQSLPEISTHILDVFTKTRTVKRKLSDTRVQKILDIERIMQIPIVAEFCTLLELGFVPYNMATKLGELQRQCDSKALVQTTS